MEGSHRLTIAPTEHAIVAQHLTRRTCTADRRLLLCWNGGLYTTTLPLSSPADRWSCPLQLSTTLVTPIDVIKSRVQNARGADAQLGIMGMISKSIKADGPTVFFRGWTPAFLRLQPQTTLLFLFFERTWKESIVRFERCLLTINLMPLK